MSHCDCEIRLSCYLGESPQSDSLELAKVLSPYKKCS